MSEKPIIAVDIDEVLMPHFQDLINYYNRLYGTRLTLADNHPKDTKGWGTDSREEAIKRVQKFFETDEFKNSQPFEEAMESIKKLAERFTLVIVTSRDGIIEETTRNWLDKHFPQLFHDAHFTGLYSLDGGAKSKAGVAKEIKADYMIDDSFDHISQAAEHGIKGLLFGEYPWNNYQELPNNVVRVKDWHEVLEYFNEK
jgi:uncharacterized HAD superfamily protein